MDFNKEIDNRYSRLDEAADELSRLFTSYNHESIFPKDNGQKTDLEKTKQMLEIIQEMYVIESELEVLNRVYEEIQH